MPEVEARFLARNPLQLDQLFELMRTFGYVVEPDRNETFVDHYYDTPNWLLLRAGWAYRWRDRGDEQTLGLKVFSLNDGPLQVREEAEQHVLVTHTRSRELPSGPVREHLAALVNGARPEELFTIHNQRLLCMVVAPDDDSTRIELVIDQAHVVAENAAKNAPGVLDFTELELELKQGRREALERLAQVLAAKADLLPARLGKFERGLQAAGLSAPVEESEAPPPPGLTDPLIRLAYHHLGEQLQLVKFHCPRAWEGLDPDGVHQMRVAIRRIRAALRVFKEVLPQRATASLRSEFRWLARPLGNVRDLDVYRDNLVHYLKTIPPDDAQTLLPYHRYLLNETHVARRRLITALDSRRYARLVDRFERFVERGPSLAALRRVKVSVGDALARYVDHGLQTVLKYGRPIHRHPSAEKLHALRIRTKRLRYTLEFFAEVRPEPLENAINATMLLQDVLGEHQDACVASARLRSYAHTVSVRARERGLLLALGQLIHSQDQHARRNREHFREEWKRFRKGISRKKLRAELRTTIERSDSK